MPLPARRKMREPIMSFVVHFDDGPPICLEAATRDSFKEALRGREDHIKLVERVH